MPDYRKFYNSAGHSEKVSDLTDFEFRVWLQMRASADDFGVGPMIPGKLQGDNRYLATKPVKSVGRAMDRVVEAGLLETFVHQRQMYYFQVDWQDREGITYPRRSVFPYPPADRISEKTKKLLQDAEGSFSKKSKKDSEKVLEEVQTLSQHPLTLTTNSNQVTTNPNKTPTLIRKRKPWNFYEGERIEVPQQWHTDHIKKLGLVDADAKLQAWYRELDAQLVRSHTPVGNWFKWLDACYVPWATDLAGTIELEAFRPKGA